jgi:TrkA-N domain
VILIMGEPGGLAEALARRLESEGVPVRRAPSLTDAEASVVLEEQRWRAVAVITRDDVLALRLALLSAHVRADLPVWVTMFDHTIARELHHVVPSVEVVSPPELVASDIARRCAEAVTPHRGWPGTRLVDDSLRLLVRAGLGLLAVLVVEALIGVIALNESVVDALYFGTRTVATVAGPPGVARAPVWYKVVSVVDTLAALLLVAIFTAALVRRLSRSRLTVLLGPRAAPARHHVLLIGFGQVGFRLAQELRRRGIPVLAVERDPEAPCIRLARAARIPVAIGRGDDRQTLERLGIRTCSAVASVTSDDLVNVAVCLAARDLAPGVPLVLRLGDGEVAAETDSLLHLGSICDAHKIVAEQLSRALSVARPSTTLG